MLLFPSINMYKEAKKEAKKEREKERMLYISEQHSH